MRQGEGLGVGSAVGERTRVREDRGIEAGGDLGRDLGACLDREVEDHGRDSAGIGIDPVDLGELPAAKVMVDVEQRPRAEAGKAGALGGIALKQDAGRGLEAWDRVDAGVDVDLVDSRQVAVDVRDRIGEDDRRLIAELLKDGREREYGADRVAIRASVRGEQQTRVLANGLAKAGEARIAAHAGDHRCGVSDGCAVVAFGSTADA